MNLFGNKPQERALCTLIHDTNGSFSVIKYWPKRIREILKELQDKGVNIDSKLYLGLEYIDSATEKAKKAIDNYYEKFAKDFPETK